MLLFSPQRISWFLLLCALWMVCIPATVGMLTVPLPAYAQEAAGGGLLGKIGSLLTNPKVLMLLAILLPLLLGGILGGGSTPQQGSVDEKAPLMPTGKDRFHSGSQTSPDPNSTGSAFNPNAPSLFVAQNTLYPTTTSVHPGDSVTLYNADANATTVTVQRTSGDQTVTEQKIDAEKSHDFRFSTAGTFKMCLKSTQTCSTVSVVP